jgi:O-antigen/teichoic acid export membrane protein
MKKKVSQLRKHPSYDKAMHWGKLISITGSAQIIVQAIGFLSGILVIRLLPVEEYALYTLANTMLGTMTLLSDGGISTGVMAQGGKVWHDKEKLGAVLATGLDLRRKFAIGSLIISTPILLYLLLHNGASWIMALLIVLSLIPAFYAALSDSLLEIVPKLHQAILPLQKNQVTVGVGRLILTALTLFVFPWTFVAILASGISRIYGNFKLRKIADEFVNKHKQPDSKVRKDILGIVYKIMPTSIFYTISGQITIWVISIFGNTTSIAQIGALGRLVVILSLFPSLIGTLIVPRFARLKADKNLLLNHYILINLFLTCSLTVLISIVYFFSDFLLNILGPQYSNLNFEFLLILSANCIGIIGGVSFALQSSRGWIRNPMIGIVIGISGVIIGALIFNMSTLKGAILFNFFIAIYSTIISFTYGIYRIKHKTIKID